MGLQPLADGRVAQCDSSLHLLSTHGGIFKEFIVT